MSRGPDLARRELWRRRLREFERGTATVAEFCRREGVSDAAFYQWRRKLASMSAEPNTVRAVEQVTAVVAAGISASLLLFGALGGLGWPPISAAVPAVVAGWIWSSAGRRDFLEIVSRGGFRDELPHQEAIQFLGRALAIRCAVFGAAMIAFFTVISLGLPGDDLSAVVLLRSLGTRLMESGDGAWRAWASVALAMLALYVVGWACAWAIHSVVIGDKVISVFQRGRKLRWFQEARAIADRLRGPSDPGIPWGGLLLPSTAAQLQFLVVGATGSGKSTHLLPLYQSVISGITPGGNHRAIIYDGKGDLLATLHGMAGPSRCRIRSFAAHDRRSCGWDIAADCDSPASAWQIAAGIFPEEPGPNRYFMDAARGLCAGVIICFIKTSPGKWSFRDLILAMQQPEYLRQLPKTVETRHLLAFLAEPRTFQNVHSGILSRLGPFESIAASYFYASEQFNLCGFVKSSSVLLLSTDEALRVPQDAINQLIHKRFTEIHLSLGADSTRRSWSFWDEVRDARKLPSLPSGLTKGRSTGLVTVLGVQDIEGLQDVYGDHVANEMLGQCGIKAILRVESPRTAEWASKLVGECEQLEFRRSNLTGSELLTESYSEQLAKREVLPRGAALFVIEGVRTNHPRTNNCWPS